MTPFIIGAIIGLPTAIYGMNEGDAVPARALAASQSRRVSPSRPSIAIAKEISMSANDHVIRATVIGDVTAERRRQVETEGWTAEHDDDHDNGELANAAACYAATTRAFYAQQVAGRDYEPYTTYRDLWPWDDKWWKPRDRRHDLIRAAALIIAEIERLDRAASCDTHPEGGDVEQAPLVSEKP